ncbi:hypothetical protein EHV15_26520 [Paenibacillus oralis]|uniref:Uncharacterized protein n=1 Tax=Paenibacillus oralis TaxID=2490856 RepID=A0A3P3U6T0_9BACL|nr:hypothetical protein [Paenibacillus oralis]RRJ66071.1 hypothetical protein EHV15_26520 [Paenibacillus oralis]
MVLDEVVYDFAKGIEIVDNQYPQAINQRSKEKYQPGIGPHTESDTTKLVFDLVSEATNSKYFNKIHYNVPYINNPRQKCDLCIGHDSHWEWCIEIKMLRFMGDNGKANDNILMHILSPYPQHRSSFTDCGKLITSGFNSRKAIMIFAYDYDEISSIPAIEAFEILANSKYILGERKQSSFTGLVHPIHQMGNVYAWEIKDYR